MFTKKTSYPVQRSDVPPHRSLMYYFQLNNDDNNHNGLFTTMFNINIKFFQQKHIIKTNKLCDILESLENGLILDSKQSVY